MVQQQERSARARAEDVGVSTKQCIELCRFVRGKLLADAMSLLEGVVEQRQAVPFRRFTDGTGHRKGMAAGRYPVKAASELLDLFENVRANATNQGLTGRLRIVHLAANRASRPMRNRLKYRGEFKRTHLEVVVKEELVTKPEKKGAPGKSKQGSKKESKDETSKKDETGKESTGKPDGKEEKSESGSSKKPEESGKKEPEDASKGPDMSKSAKESKQSSEKSDEAGKKEGSKSTSSGSSKEVKESQASKEGKDGD